jgi:serine phosphatase RsbU (regulator of sigma subunit)
VFSGPIDPDDLGDVIVRQAVTGCHADTAMFVTVENDGRLLVTGSYGVGPDDDAPAREIAADARLPVTDAMRFREPVWASSKADRDQRYPQLGSVRGCEASVALPLIVGSDVRGALVVGFRDARDFDEADRFSIRTFAHLSALAVGRVLPPVARHRPAGEEERTEQRALAALAQQRRTVEFLQRALLPDLLPSFGDYELAACYVPAGTEAPIGGDWYDAFVSRDDRLVVAIGDVAGHGVRATAGMAQLRHALRAYAFAGHGPGETLSLLDEQVSLLAPDAFATATLFVCSRGGDVAYARAGHPPALLAEATGVRALADGARPPLGAGHATVEEGHLTLAAGSRLVLYTDGLVEQRETGFDAGIADLVGAISDLGDADAETSSKAVLEACPGGREPRDDVCLLVVSRRELR